MAALRYGTRRLGGSAIQRPRQIYTAAMEDSQGGRPVWPTSSRRSGSPSSSGAANSSTEDACAKPAAELLDPETKEFLARAQLKKINEKKEELFREIAKMDRQFPSRCSREDTQLLMILSEYVEPKPNDCQWRFFRRAKRCNEYFIIGSVLYTTYLYISDEMWELYAAIKKRYRRS